jgi:hypothetical protein
MNPLKVFASIVTVVTVALSGTIVRGEDPVFSGPQVGEPVPGFELMGVYDEMAGKAFDPIAAADGKPTLLIFVHKLTRPGFALARGLTAYAKAVGNGYVAVAWLSDDKAEAEAYLNRARKSLNVKVPMGVSVDGGQGPGAYGLNRNVELTILVAKDNRVTANFALVQPSPAEAVTIAAEYAKALGIDPPSSEQLQRIAFPKRQMRRMNARRGGGKRAQQRPAAQEKTPQPTSDS